MQDGERPSAQSLAPARPLQGPRSRCHAGAQSAGAPRLRPRRARAQTVSLLHGQAHLDSARELAPGIFTGGARCCLCDLVDLRAFIQSGLPSLGSSGGAHALTASRPALRLPPTPAPSGNLDQLLGPAGVPGNPGVPGGPGGSGRGAPAGPSPLGGAAAHLSGAGREGLRGPGAAGPPPGRPGPGGARQAPGELKTSGSAASGLTAAAASMLAVPRPPGSPEHAPVMDGAALRQAREPRPPAPCTALLQRPCIR